MNNNKILIIDDSKTIRQLFKKLLTDFFSNIFETPDSFLFATNGKEGLELLEENSSEILLVITDVFMPKVGGKEFVIKAIENHPNLKIIAASDKASKEEVIDLLKFGAIDFIDKKSFNKKIIVEKIKEPLKEIFLRKASISKIEEDTNRVSNQKKSCYNEVFDFLEKELQENHSNNEYQKLIILKNKFFTICT